MSLGTLECQGAVLHALVPVDNGMMADCTHHGEKFWDLSDVSFLLWLQRDCTSSSETPSEAAKGYVGHVQSCDECSSFC